MVCNFYLDVIDRFFVLINCFHVLFAKVFSAQFTVTLVNVKVYFTKFEQKITIRESLFLEFREFFFSRKFLPAKDSALKVVTVSIDFALVPKKYMNGDA